MLTSMGKQVRLPEKFVENLRENFDGKNDYQRLKSWKNKEATNQLAELVEKVDNLDVNDSSTSMNKSYIETLVEEKITELRKRGKI